ncbi:MAG: glycosyltransferase family 4 protein [Phycisphaerae bacterium]
MPPVNKVVYLAAGAGGMFCGSCLRDNRLAVTLARQGRDITLLPLYTPLQTDEPDASVGQVYYGGINVYLQQHLALFRHTPRFLDRLLDSPRLLRSLGRFAARTQPEQLGRLTVSVLQGDHGPQRKELDRLIEGLARHQPDLINLPNLLFSGVAGPLKKALGVPVLCTLSGEDFFVDQLPEPFRSQALDLIARGSDHIDGFVAVTRYFGDRAARHFHLPTEKVHHVPMGVPVDSSKPPATPPPEPFTIGYLARICPEKGLAELADAFVRIRKEGRACRLRVAGYLSPAHQSYWEQVQAGIAEAGFGKDVDDVGQVDLAGKQRFLQSVHVLSVPAVYPEAKGLYVLEALAAGVPVVQPAEGSFVELIEQTGGGLLVPPGDIQALADGLGQLMDDDELRVKLASQGRSAVAEGFSEEVMAQKTWALYSRFFRSS